MDTAELSILNKQIVDGSIPKKLLQDFSHILKK